MHFQREILISKVKSVEFSKVGLLKNEKQRFNDIVGMNFNFHGNRIYEISGT